MAEDLREVDPGLLSPLYADNVVFKGSLRSSVQILKMLMYRGPYWGYFPKPDKLVFISNTLDQEQSYKRGFVAEGVELGFLSSRW